MLTCEGSTAEQVGTGRAYASRSAGRMYPQVAESRNHTGAARFGPSDSYTCATRSTISSSKGLPAICSPTGRPCELRPQGTESRVAGQVEGRCGESQLCQRLHHGVAQLVHTSQRPRHDGHCGVRITSTFCSTSFIPRVIARRAWLALEDRAAAQERAGPHGVQHAERVVLRPFLDQGACIAADSEEKTVHHAA